MKNETILSGGNTPALTYAVHTLQKSGFTVRMSAGMDIRYLLFDVPSFHADGNLRSGRDLDTLLAALPSDIIICGGNLKHPKLEQYHKIDFLQDDLYLSKNAGITADCAVQIAMQHLTTTLDDSPALIIGWGRIGKCLARTLRQLGCNVTVAVRKSADHAILSTLGYDAVYVSEAEHLLPKYRLIFNTAPAKVLDVSVCRNCVCIDLASQKGLIGDNVIWARGLPGMYAPETSGKLVAQTFMRLAQEVRE